MLQKKVPYFKAFVNKFYFHLNQSLTFLKTAIFKRTIFCSNDVKICRGKNMKNSSDNTKDYITYKDLVFKLNNHRISQARVDFTNGWGASIIDWDRSSRRFDFYHGYELAVMRNGMICYNSEVTDDVIHMDDISELNSHLRDIQDLDENGFIRRSADNTKNSTETRIHIETRKKQILKSRILRKEIEKREGTVSDVVLADEIARDKISGKEKRTITPEVGAEIKRRKTAEK